MSKSKNSKIKIKAYPLLLKSVGKLGLMLLLLLSVAAWRGQFFGVQFDSILGEKEELTLDLKLCSRFFYKAEFVNSTGDNKFTIYDNSKNEIGYASWHKGEHGYSGRVPLFLFTDVNDTIKGVILGENYESADYMSGIVKAHFLSRWNKLSINDIATADIDAVAGATITSNAIIKGVGTFATNDNLVNEAKAFPWEQLLSIVLLIILTYAYFYPRRVAKYRFVLQILTIIVFGFYLNQFISFGLIVNWLSGGANWQVYSVLVVVLFLSILLPLLFGRAFYCTWVCPYGAAQELCGKLNKRKIVLSAKVNKRIKRLREYLFTILIVILWLGVTFDLTLIEPFSAFTIAAAGRWVLSLAIFFLILSMFIPKVWCRYFCPTGYILDWVKK